MKPLSKVNFLVVHATDTPAKMNVTTEHLRQWHVIENGWSDIGYHYLIDREGQLHRCRDEMYQGAHCPPVNGSSLAIAMAGGWKGKNNYTEKQMNKLFGLLLAKTTQYPNAAVAGHNHFASKPCPCFNVTQWFYDRLATPTQRGFITP